MRVATAVFLLLLIQSVLAESRGLSVKVRQSEAPNAPIIGEFELYGSSHALVIGIDNYASGWPRLSKAVSDARSIANALEERGFEVTLVIDPDGRTLLDAFETFFIDSGEDPEARLFVWFAGHGHTIGTEGFLVPADGVPPASERRFKRNAISLRRFGEFVRLANSKHTLAVFDSCFAGTIFDVARAAPPPAITRVTSQPVRQFVSSGDAGQKVSDDGTFARLFVDALEGTRRADLNSDGYLTGGELGSFLTNNISNYTNNRQVPRYGKLRDPNYDKGDFVFEVDPVGGLLGNSGANQPDTGGRPSRFDPEHEFWSAIRDSQDPSDYESYLNEYPDGDFATLAGLKLRRLSRPPARNVQFAQAELRVFEDGDQNVLRAYGDRVYGTRFDVMDVRRMWLELHVRNTDRDKEHSHDVEFQWVKPSGELQGSVNAEFVIKPEWEYARIERGWGWADYGNWQEGTYTARALIDDVIVETPFTIYGQAPATEVSQVELRIFEGGDRAREHDGRTYGTRFKATEVRRLWFELHVLNTNRGAEHSHDVEFQWIKPNGELQGRLTGNFVIKPEWEVAWIERGWGWSEYGNWPRGTYTARAYIDGRKFEQPFTIY